MYIARSSVFSWPGGEAKQDLSWRRELKVIISLWMRPYWVPTDRQEGQRDSSHSKSIEPSRNWVYPWLIRGEREAESAVSCCWSCPTLSLRHGHWALCLWRSPYLVLLPRLARHPGFKELVNHFKSSISKTHLNFKHKSYYCIIKRLNQPTLYSRPLDFISLNYVKLSIFKLLRNIFFILENFQIHRKVAKLCNDVLYIFIQFPRMLTGYIGRAHLANSKINISTLLLSELLYLESIIFFTNLLFLFQDAIQHTPLHLVQLDTKQFYSVPLNTLGKSLATKEEKVCYNVAIRLQGGDSLGDPTSIGIHCQCEMLISSRI